MPRKKPRFSDLKDDMITAMSTGQDPKTSTNKALAKFAQWYLEPNDRAQLDAGSKRNRGAILSVALYGFYTVGAATHPGVITTISDRAAVWLKTKAALLTATNLITANNAILAASEIKNFYPAQAVIREYDPAAAERNPISKITGRRYTTKQQPGDKGYVIPFGTNLAGDKSVGEAQDAIKAALAVLTKHKVNFKPEEYSEARANAVLV